MINVATYGRTDFNQRINEAFKYKLEYSIYLKNHLKNALDCSKYVHEEARWRIHYTDYLKSQNCLNFITANGGLAVNWFELTDQYLKENGYPNWKKLNSERYLKDAEFRRTQAKWKEPYLNWEDCTPPLEPSFVEQRVAEIKSAIASIEIKQDLRKKLDFSMHHPRDQEILNQILKNARPWQYEKRGKAHYAYSKYLTDYGPKLNEKAESEIKRMILVNCPGVFEKIWTKCTSDPKYSQGKFESIPQMYCILDNKLEIDAKCFVPL